MIRPTNYDVTINSSVMFFDNSQPAINEIWNHFANSGLRDYFLRKYVGIDRYIQHEEFRTHPLQISTSWKYDEVHNRPLVTFEEVDDWESISERLESDS